MAQQQPFLEGSDLTLINIAGLIPDANGVLTAGTVYDLYGQILEVDPTIQKEFEDTRPVWSKQINNILTGQGSALRLSCLQWDNGFNPLTLIVWTFQLVVVNWQQGQEDFGPAYYTITGHNGGVKNRGGNPTILELGPFDPSVAQVTYSHA